MKNLVYIIEQLGGMRYAVALAALGLALLLLAIPLSRAGEAAAVSSSPLLLRRSPSASLTSGGDLCAHARCTDPRSR